MTTSVRNGRRSRSAFGATPDEVLIFAVAGVTGLTVIQPGVALRTGVAVCLVALIVKIPTLVLAAPEILAILLACLTIESLGWTTSDFYTSESAKNFVGIAILLITIRAYATTDRNLRLIILGYLGGCVVAVWQLFRSDTFVSVRFNFDTNAARETIDGLNANYLAYALTTGATLIVLLWAGKRPALVGRVATGVFLALLYAAGVVQTGTRGALVSVIGLTVFLVAYRLRVPHLLGWLYGIAAAVNVLIVTGWADEYLRSEQGSNARDAGDLAGRLVLWPAARSEFWERPLLGGGADVFPSLNLAEAPAHNAILDIGVGLGVVGIVLFLWLLKAALIDATRGFEKRSLVLGSFVVVSVPILASGFWVESAAFWAAVAIFSRAGVLLKPTPEPEPLEPPRKDYVHRR